MVDWMNPEVQALCGFSFRMVAVFSTGLYVWYWILTLHKVEWALLRAKMRFTWAHISYFIARYCELGTILTIWPSLNIIASNTEKAILNCDSTAALKATATLGSVAVAAASTNLGLRAVATWKDIPFIKIALAVICAVHGVFALCMGLQSVQAKWDSAHRVCMIVTSASQRQLLGFYTFTLMWDLIILAFTLVGMRRQGLPSNSPLWTALFSQGLGYVVISCIACIPMMVMVSLNLNNTMNVILTVPGGTICVITSSAFVTSLLEMRGSDPSGSLCSQPPSERACPPRKNEGVSHALTTHIDVYMSEFRSSIEIMDDRPRKGAEEESFVEGP